VKNRQNIFETGEYYHLYSRGNSKQDIFLDNHDRERFTKLLYLCNSTKNINFRDDIVNENIDAWDFDRGGRILSIGAWVMMSNHFHLYVKCLDNSESPMSDIGDDIGDNGISMFMRKLLTSYVKYFNKKYERTGGLFEGKFKSVHITDDNQAKYLFSYNHLNPVKIIDPNWKENGIRDQKKVLDFLDGYRWSSYSDFREVKRPENKIINPNDFPEYFSDVKVFDQEIFDWLSYNLPMSDIG